MGDLKETGGNRSDVTQLIPLLDAIPPVRGRVGHPRRKSDWLLFASRDYFHDVYRGQGRAPARCYLFVLSGLSELPS